MKKFFGLAAAAALLAGQSLAVTAATPLGRSAAPVGEAEEDTVSGGISSLFVIVGGIVAAVTTVLVVEAGENNDRPESP